MTALSRQNQLLHHLAVDLIDLLLQVLEVLVEPFEDRD
ncbi:hypothetical protein OKW33_005794 [Paraburkholderia atlantica]